MNEEQKKAIERARAFGLMAGACEGMMLRLPVDERKRIQELINEAKTLWGEEL